MPRARATSAWRARLRRTMATADRDPRDARRTRRTARRDDPARDPDTCSAPYRVRFDEAGPDGLLRTSVLLRYAQDLAWYHSAPAASTGPGTPSAGSPGWSAPPRSPSSRRSPSAPSWSGRPGSSAGAGSGPAAGPSSVTPPGALVGLDARSTGCCSTRAALRPGSRPSSSRCSAPRRPRSAWRA